ncbi:MAG: TIGR04282 family arsenosugar biosynthesis glycosyltransferase [Myxococcaceae bacterium]
MLPTPGVVAVFAKPPRPGEVKTRLGAVLGHEAATRLARAFFEDTWNGLQRVPDLHRVIASTTDEPAAFGAPTAEVWLQGEGDLGARIERIARRALAQAPWFIALGADSPGLPAARLEAARAALLRHDAVLGPAEDGGYYLLGLKRLSPGLFADLPWSTNTTFNATRHRLVERGYSVATIQTWFDVDEPSDLERLRTELASGTLQAPRTAAALAKLSAR